MCREVPARVGGVDLSFCTSCRRRGSWVPARVGGVDLSIACTVPARVGGVDLSDNTVPMPECTIVPARVGGVDLSLKIVRVFAVRLRPRPCGRGGFKLEIEPEVNKGV